MSTERDLELDNLVPGDVLEQMSPEYSARVLSYVCPKEAASMLLYGTDTDIDAAVQHRALKAAAILKEVEPSSRLQIFSRLLQGFGQEFDLVLLSSVVP